jgi:hypothetical protein
MGAMLERMRSGDWVTRERVRLVAIGLLIAYAAGLAYLAATANGLNDAGGRPLGTDFANVYAAGTLVLEMQTRQSHRRLPCEARGAGAPCMAAGALGQGMVASIRQSAGQ